MVIINAQRENTESELISEPCNIKMLDIERVMQEVIQSNDDLFYIVRESRYTNRGEVLSRNKKLFEIMLKPIGGVTTYNFEIHRFNPYVALFIRLRDQMLHGAEGVKYLLKDGADNLPKVVASLNNFIHVIRLESNTPKFKAAVRAYYRQSKENYENLIAYINGLFERNSRLLVIRLDLAYHKDCDNLWLTENALNAMYWQSKIDLRHFYTNLRTNKLFEHMLGYAWKLEYAQRTGFHFHMVFFYDGRMVREDISIAECIGLYWRDTITKGRGRYWSCNRDKKQYQQVGIGMIKHDDFELRNGLEKAVAYLTKPDEYAYEQMALPGNGRCFGKTELRPKSNRGRPRINSRSVVSGEPSISVLNEYNISPPFD